MGGSLPSYNEVISNLTADLFEQPLMLNNFRAIYAEYLVAALLSDEWKHCGTGWSSWDIEHRSNGKRIEVKQSAARQSWHSPSSRTTYPSFDIAPRTGYWNNDNWVEGEGRPADIYIFAWHPVSDETCDHRCPGQWKFYAVPESNLPEQKSLSLSKIRRLAREVSSTDLLSEVNRLLYALPDS